MEPRPRTSSRVSSFEFAQKTGTAGLRDSDPALIRNVSISSSRNILSTKDGWPLGDWTNKNTIITRDVTSGRHSKRSSHSAKTNRRSMSNSAAVQDTMPYIQRWAGLTRTASNWDGLRRDPELWIDNGNCYVHLYAQGASRRGPSFCIPYRALHQKKCGAMLNICHAQLTSAEGVCLQQLSEISNLFNSTKHQSSIIELFIPAPEGISREDSFKWHVTTRNFFAFVLGKPLVGYHMGQTFVDLQERMQLFRSRQPSKSHQDFLEYAECQGYRDLVEVTDYALANLFYAEYFKLRDIWVDAFAHCVGMKDSLACSPEYQLNSRLTKALITRARLEVDVHLGQVSKALSNFLEEDMSSAYLGLTAGTRSQLIRFQRFLHSFYTEKFGYWPPLRGILFPKALYKSMFYDFQSLYDYLVDTESTTDISSQKPASGGICVLQNVDNFDRRHNFITLPHPLPLLPKDLLSAEKTESQNAFKQLATTCQHNKARRIQSLSTALALATNTQDKTVVHSKIVQRYMHFENMCAHQASSHRGHGIPAADARKVRWLLIYGALQYLTSALRAPKEVRDADTPEYPLCCFITEEKSWNDKFMESTTTPVASPITTRIADNYFPESEVNSSIQPDCQREDYLGPGSISRRGSVELPAPLKRSLSTHNSAIRSLAAISLPRRNSRRNSLSTKAPSYHEIMIYGYGNGLNETVTGPLSPTTAHAEYISEPKQSSRCDMPDADGSQMSWPIFVVPPALRNDQPVTSEISHHTRQQTRVVHTIKLDMPDGQTSPDDPDRSDSPNSVTSQIWSDTASATSSKTSAGGGNAEYKAGTAEQNSLVGGISTNPTEFSPKSVHPSTFLPPTGFSFGFENEVPTLPSTTNAFPTGVPDDETIGTALSVPPLPLTTTTTPATTIHSPLASTPIDTPPATKDASFVSEHNAASPVVMAATKSTMHKKRSSISVFSSLSALLGGKPTTSTQKARKHTSI